MIMVHDISDAKEICYKFKQANGQSKIVAVKGVYVTGNLKAGGHVIPIPVFQNNNNNPRGEENQT
jgi:hypothetical protein